MHITNRCNHCILMSMLNILYMYMYITIMHIFNIHFFLLFQLYKTQLALCGKLLISCVCVFVCDIFHHLHVVPCPYNGCMAAPWWKTGEGFVESVTISNRNFTCFVTGYIYNLSTRSNIILCTCAYLMQLGLILHHVVLVYTIQLVCLHRLNFCACMLAQKLTPQ